jgi:hypothetical protein
MAVRGVRPASAGRAIRTRRAALPRRAPIGAADTETHLAGLVDRRDQQPDVDRQQLDFDQPNTDVAGNHDTLVENPLEQVREVAYAVVGRDNLRHASTFL